MFFPLFYPHNHHCQTSLTSGLRYTLYKQESDNIKATMFGANAQQTGANIKNTVRAKQVV